MQVVRYHSLVIDEDSLPKELVPIAWTCSSNTLSFLDTSCLIPDSFLGNGSSSFALPGGNLQSDKVLMGIKHVIRPHYGLQVLLTCITIDLPLLSYLPYVNLVS